MPGYPTPEEAGDRISKRRLVGTDNDPAPAPAPTDA
jgi:hypothetical protein